MNRARQLWHYLTKVFDLPRRLRAVRTDRPAAQIPLPKLDAYDVRTIWQLGHRRWGIENELFNVLTQHYHLTHCPHHHPVAILAGLLFLVYPYFATTLTSLVTIGLILSAGLWIAIRLGW